MVTGLAPVARAYTTCGVVNEIIIVSTYGLRGCPAHRPARFRGRPGFRFLIRGTSRAFSSITQSRPIFVAGRIPARIIARTRIVETPSRLAAASVPITAIATLYRECFAAPNRSENRLD